MPKTSPVSAEQHARAARTQSLRAESSTGDEMLAVPNCANRLSHSAIKDAKSEKGPDRGRMATLLSPTGNSQRAIVRESADSPEWIVDGVYSVTPGGEWLLWRSWDGKGRACQDIESIKRRGPGLDATKSGRRAAASNAQFQRRLPASRHPDIDRLAGEAETLGRSPDFGTLANCTNARSLLLRHIDQLHHRAKSATSALGPSAPSREVRYFGTLANCTIARSTLLRHMEQLHHRAK